MTDVLSRLYDNFGQELASRPAEFFARNENVSYNVNGFLSIPWSMLPADRVVQLQTVSVLLSQSGSTASVRVISVGINIHLEDSLWPSQFRTFLAHRHCEQTTPNSGHIIPFQGSLGFNVATGATVTGAFTFPELNGVVIPPSVRLGTAIEVATVSAQVGWMTTSVTGWSLPRGNIA